MLPLDLLYLLRGGGSERARGQIRQRTGWRGERKISHQDISHSTCRVMGERREAAGKPSYTPTDTFPCLPAETYYNMYAPTQSSPSPFYHNHVIFTLINYTHLQTFKRSLLNLHPQPVKSVKE